MKTTFKIYSVFVVFLSGLLSAQTPYYKMLGADNSWYISGHYFSILSKTNDKPSAGSLGVAGQGEYRARIDSVVNAKTYKIFVHSPGSYTIFEPAMVSCLVREDTVQQKVYVIPRDSSAERIVIDFSLNVADSIFLTYPNINLVINSGYYRVDSVRYRSITAGIRKHLYLAKRLAPVNGITGRRIYIEWIESVGAVHFPVNIIDQQTGSSNWKALPDWYTSCNGKQQLGTFVSCKITDGEKIYHDSCSYNHAVQNYSPYLKSKSSCDYYVLNLTTGIKELSNTASIHVFPQPVSNELNIQLKGESLSVQSIQCFASNGQQLVLAYTANEKEIKCDVNVLAPGLYVIVFKLSNGTGVSRRFIKE